MADQEKLLEKQVSNALQAVRKSKSGLITIHDLPTPWKYNLHIEQGYRFSKSSVYCIRSIFILSNETFNIWSHLLASILLVAISGDGPPVSSLNDSHGRLLVFVYYCYIIAALICTTLSVSWHTMRCISDHDTMSCFSSLDLMGVTTLIIASVLVTQFIAFADSEFWQYVYISASIVLGTVGLTISWLPIMRHPKLSWTRVFVWGALVVQGLAIPILHLLWTKGLKQTLKIYGPVIPAYVPIGLGSIIYATQFPECCWPGCFDYIGSSHNIWHLASFYGIWLGIQALKHLSETIA